LVSAWAKLPVAASATMALAPFNTSLREFCIVYSLPETRPQSKSHEYCCQGLQVV
jgi:hypothetical protein